MMSQAERSQFASEINAAVSPLGAAALSWRVEDFSEVAIFSPDANPIYIKDEADWSERRSEIEQELKKTL